MMTYTVNVVIFTGGKFRKKSCQDLSRGGNFHDTSHISLIKSYGVYFRVGKFSQRRQYREKRENYPHTKISTFTVNVILWHKGQGQVLLVFDFEVIY